MGPRHLHFSATPKMILMCCKPWEPAWGSYSRSCLHKLPWLWLVFHLDPSPWTWSWFPRYVYIGSSNCVQSCLPASGSFSSHPNLLFPLCFYLNEWCQTSMMSGLTSQRNRVLVLTLSCFPLLYPLCPINFQVVSVPSLVFSKVVIVFIHIGTLLG